MTDAITEFAQLAAMALRDITDPDVTQTSADEALAALEQHVTALPREHRCAGKLVGRILWTAHGDPHRTPACTTEVVLTYARTALRWAHMGAAAASLLKCGEEIGYARESVRTMPREHAELRALLKLVVDAVEQACVEVACERLYGGRNAA